MKSFEKRPVSNHSQSAGRLASCIFVRAAMKTGDDALPDVARRATGSGTACAAQQKGA